MTSRERFDGFLSRTRIDRVPVQLQNLFLAAQAIRTPFSVVCRNAELVARGHLLEWEKYRHDGVIVDTGTHVAAESLGCAVREVNVDWMRGAALANRLMTQSDGAAVHADRLAREPERFGDDVRRRLEAGARTTSTEYILARRTQAEVRRTCDRLFETADLLLLPTTPMPAPVIAGYDAVERAGQLTPFTAPFNLTGLPALSVPCGFTTGGLPIGLQIVGKGWEEGRVLAAGHAFEQRTDWHTRTPDI